METRLSAGDVVPPGVSFAPRHVMCVPSAPHFGDDLQSEEDVHHVLKIHREGDAYKFQKFGNFTRIDSEYCLETTEGNVHLILLKPLTEDSGVIEVLPIPIKKDN